MMKKILKIRVIGYLENFSFEVETENREVSQDFGERVLKQVGFASLCYHCHRAISPIYDYIIYNLGKANLLRDDFKPICCYCRMALKYMGKLKCECGRHYSHGFENSMEVDELDEKTSALVTFYCAKCKDRDYMFELVPDEDEEWYF